MKNLQLTLRSILHYKQYSIINILGLILSLSCFIIISRYVYSEMMVDRFNKNLDRMFILIRENTETLDEWRFSNTFKDDTAERELFNHSGIEYFSDFIKMNDKVTVDNQSFNVEALIADDNFLNIADYPILYGNKSSRPEEVLITATFAKKVFGQENPIGKIITYSQNLQKQVTIAGVIGKTQTKSSLSFDVIIPFDLNASWNTGSQTLFLLYQDVNVKDVNQQFAENIVHNSRYQLFPYKDIYFNTYIVNWGLFRTGNYFYVFILSLVGILILAIGIINYLNIYSVIALRRGKEFGMKKVFGGTGLKIFVEFFTENFLLMTVSLLLAFGITELITPAVRNFLGIEQVTNPSFDVWLSVSLVLILSLLVSIIPFLRYQYALPIKSLQSVALSGKSLVTRRVFLVFQYLITIVMIVVSLFFVKQLHFMLNTDLGFRSENIIKVPFLQSFLYSPDMDWRARFEKNEQIMQIVKQRMDASPLFDNWALGRGTPNELANSTLEFRAPGGELQKTTLMRADNEWFNVFDIKLIAGRNFIKEIDDLSYNLIVSESVLKQFGIDNYEDALLESSRRIWFAGGIGRDTEMATNPPFRIVGVVKDFCPVHLSQQQYSLTFYFMDGSSNPAHPILASLNPSNRQQVIEFMRNLHEELVGGEFTYSFIEDEMATIYKEDRKIAVIYSIFTLIAIFISALGLFALSLFDIQQRRKEIAIRKVNGANTNDIIILLLKRYAILLSIAFLISVPISLFAIHRYLESFAYKAVISWWLFAVALAITGIVSLLTLIYQTYKASNENPAEVVKGK